MSRSVVDPSGLPPDMEHQDQVRLDTDADCPHISSIRCHAGRHGGQHLLHHSRRFVGHFGSQIGATGWYKPVLEIVICLQVFDRRSRLGRFQDSLGSVESIQNEQAWQLCHGCRGQ